MKTQVNRFVFLVLLVPFVIACANTTNGTATTPTTGSSAASTSAVTTDTAIGAPTIDEAVTGVWNAMRTGNETSMRTYMPQGLIGMIGSQQWREIMSCVPAGSTVTLAGHTVQQNGNTDKVTVTFNVSSNSGTPYTMTKVWVFVHTQSGAWALLTLPGCPFKNG